MANGDNGRCVFPLTGFQIGDLQSYLSHLNLFMASDSGKFYILVDNRPWLKDLVLRPTHLWQLMVTKSRLSPFAITKRMKDREMIRELSDLETSPSSNSSNLRNFKEWCTLVDAVTMSRKRASVPVKKLRNSLIANSKLHRTLYGFIVFEVAWRDVRGINYLNELQTDTSLAIEAKVMRRWEFDSIAQAAKSISSWFPGTQNERILLKEHLDATIDNVKDNSPKSICTPCSVIDGVSPLPKCLLFRNIPKFDLVTGEVFHDARESFQRSNEADIGDTASGTSVQADSSCSSSSSFSMYPAAMEKMMNVMHRLHTPPPADGPYKRRKLMSPVRFDLGLSSDEADSETAEILSHNSDLSDCEETLQPSLNRDVLILFRFDDRDLPFKIRDIIMPDLRLLTLLEAGLPSWVIFLQSYPVFCHLYRPWMCPLARFCYVLISIVTVLIGFYDLYKNVPLLKATASRLFGPLFDWIESLEMISRIKYLGTMLFLHNSQKAIKWFLNVTRTFRSFLTLVVEPMAGPFAEFLEFFLPLWSIFIEVAASLVSVTWMVVGSCFTMVGDLIEILLLPLWYILALVCNIAISIIYPIFWILWEILYTPIRLVLGFCSLVAYLCTLSYELIGDLLLFASSLFNFTRDVESTVSAYEVSVWRSLWNDLGSQIFRALRSILNGLVAFFTTCNRHRLSTYNHMKELHNRLSRKPRRAGAEKNGQDIRTAKAQVTPRGRSISIATSSPGTVR